MTNENSFPLSLAFEGRHYSGTITPSAEKGAGGIPVFFRVTIENEVFAHLCCGDNGWRDLNAPGQPAGLVSAIGNYIFEYYE